MPGAQTCSKTRVSQLIRVAIAQLDLDPAVFNGLVQPTLEIGIPDFEEMIASKEATAGFGENLSHFKSYLET